MALDLRTMHGETDAPTRESGLREPIEDQQESDGPLSFLLRQGWRAQSVSASTGVQEVSVDLERAEVRISPQRSDAARGAAG